MLHAPVDDWTHVYQDCGPAPRRGGERAVQRGAALALTVCGFPAVAVAGSADAWVYWVNWAESGRTSAKFADSSRLHFSRTRVLLSREARTLQLDACRRSSHP